MLFRQIKRDMASELRRLRQGSDVETVFLHEADVDEYAEHHEVEDESPDSCQERVYDQELSQLRSGELTQRQQSVITGLYDLGMTLQEIADSIGVSRQRVHQIHCEALSILREGLT